MRTAVLYAVAPRCFPFCLDRLHFGACLAVKAVGFGKSSEITQFILICLEYCDQLFYGHDFTGKGYVVVTVVTSEESHFVSLGSGSVSVGKQLSTVGYEASLTCWTGSNALTDPDVAMNSRETPQMVAAAGYFPTVNIVDHVD